MSKKAIIITVVVVAVAVFGYISVTSDSSNATNVKVTEVVRQNLTEKVSASGRIQPQTKVDITSEITGEIIALQVVEGQRVNMGELLVMLDTVQIKADVRRGQYALGGARAGLSGAEASYAQADEEYQRQQRLFEQNLTSETALSNAKYSYLNAKAAMEGAQAQESGAQAAYDKELDRLSKAKIVAPMEGVITFLDCEVGEIAAAQTSFTQGRTLMTISDLAVFEVEVEVDETEINKVELGQTAEIEVDAIPDTSFAGEVVEIGNTAIMLGAGTQDQSTNFRVKVMFTDAFVKLRPGMSATVDITSAEHNEVLAIPFASVVMRGYDMDSLETARLNEDEDEAGPIDVQAAENDGEEVEEVKDEDEKREDLKGVFVIRDGKARFVTIETGIAGQKNIEITEGLEESDTVISGPYRILRTIKDGDEIDISDSEGNNEEEA
jgi:HlyD family secretion protein